MNTSRRFIVKFKQLAIIISILFAVLIVCAAAFIKFNTPAAAEFTDNVLRPLLGRTIVLNMEKIYYNFSDSLKKLTFNESKITPPEFLDSLLTSNSTNSGQLDLRPISPLLGLKPISGEGVWNSRQLSVFPGRQVMAYTFIRPDKDRPYAFVTVVQIDKSVTHLSAVAGTKQPGGPVGQFGPGVVPQHIINSGKLIAAFDGGFQYRDGEYGMIVGDKTYLPLKENVGTLIGYKNGSLKIINYTGQPLGDNVEFVRQNCPILVDNNRISILNPQNKKLWGRTMTADIYTWRSGLGLTSSGNLIYAIGNSLTPLTLSYALKMAGAVNAIQLDINPYWVRFNIFDWVNGQYKTSTLIKQIQDGSSGYLHGYSKDFFYVYKN